MKSRFRTSIAGVFASLVSETPYDLTLRYLFTRRCGLIDMRHLIQLMYLSTLPTIRNRGATREGVTHEETSEARSKYGSEDLPSNALGAWTGTQLPRSPADLSRSFTPAHLLGTIRATLQRCEPVTFNSLSATSQQTIVDFYGAGNVKGH